MSQLEKIVKLTKSQYESMMSASPRQISYTGGTHVYDENNLYVTTDETFSVEDLSNDFILPVSKGGTGKTQFASGSLLVGNGQNALTEIGATDQNIANTIVKRDSNGGFSMGILKVINSGNTTTIGSQNSGWCHIYNSSNWPFIFNNSVAATGGASSTATLGTSAYPFHQLILGGTTNATMTAASANPRITFQEGTGTQPVHLIYTDQDSYRTPAGLKIIGGSSATPAWFEVEGSIFANGGNRVPHTGNTTGSIGGTTTPVYVDAGQIKTGTALKDLAYIAKPSQNTTTTYLRGDGSWVGLADMGLSNALHFIGVTTTDMTGGTATNHSWTGTPAGISNYTPKQGDVVINSTKQDEWVCTSVSGTTYTWERLGSDTSYKIVQSAVSSATDETSTATRFVHSVTQDANGVITVKTRPLPTYNNYSHPTGDGNLHVPATGTSNNGKVLKAGSTAGSISWGTLSASDVGAAAADHGTHVTTATVQSALSISSSGSGSKALTEKGTFVTFGTSNLTIGTTGSTAMAGNTTVTNVAISADTTTNKNYALVFGTTPSDGTTPTAAKTEGLQKNSAKFYVNPSTGALYATKLYSGNTEVSVNGHTHSYLSSISWSGDTNLKLKQSVNGATATDVLQFVAGSNITLTAAAGSLTIAGVGDTKNTAGSTDSTSKLFLIGATSQAANPQTYSDSHVFETNGALSAKTLGVNADTDTNKVTLQWNSTDSALEFVFA